jgi:ABC-type multidrug transport system fused ATPase/permease subunit
MTLAALIIVPFQLGAQRFGIKAQHMAIAESNDKNKNANLLLGDAIMNFRTVQSFGREDLIAKKYDDFMRPAAEAVAKADFVQSCVFGVSQFFTFIVNAAMFGFAMLIIKHTDAKQEDVFMVIFVMLFASQEAGNATGWTPDLAKASAASERVFDFIDVPSEISAPQMTREKSGKGISNVVGKIEFRDVWFRYPTRPDEFVLKGLNLTIEPGQSVALVGESGCGKSTFVNLMMRFYDPNAGQILLDGVPLPEYNLHELRKAISLVMQEPIIFNYSITENVLYGKLDASNQQIFDACQLANCNDFIEEQKNREKEEEVTAEMLLNEMEAKKEEILRKANGDEELVKKFNEHIEILKKMKEAEAYKGKFAYHENDIDSRTEEQKGGLVLHEGFKTVCGLKGNKLSGGQKQRVAIARTVIRDPKVLMLDEATSALDEDSQKKVQLALEQASRNRTTIIIAHRMSTIEACDKIFVLESGTLSEEGAFDALKEKGGLFSKLSKQQQSATAPPKN